MKAKVLCFTQLVEKSPQAIPLGAACIASAIKNSKFTKDFCQVTLLSFYPDETAEQIEEKLLKQFSDSTDNGNSEKTLKICCFSIFVWNRIAMEKIAENLQKNEILCVAGGPEVTAHPECFKSFDAVTAGEGEEKVPFEIAKLLNQHGAHIAIPATVSAPDLQKLASPYLDGTINPMDYGGVLWELARGCPFKCSYCYESKGEKTVRMFPLERIKKELDLFAEMKVPQVFVLDPTYNADKKRAIQLLNLIAEKTPDTFYYFEARAEFIDRELAHAFTKIPCAVQIGLQSADEEVLKLVHRSFNKKQFIKNIGFLNDAGVVFGFDLIYGLPGESLRGFKDGIDFAISLYPNNLELFCLSVLPGTDLYDRAEALQLHFEENPPYHILYTDKYSKADIEQAGKLSEACSIFYNEGRAVPWFNTICRSIKIKPSAFFTQFAEFPQFKDFILKNQKQNKEDRENNCECKATCHKEIEALQVDFVTDLLKQKKMDRYVKAAADIIRLNGAISRVQDTGKNERVKLNYPADYVDSEYATDLAFFTGNVKLKPCTVEIYRQKGQIRFR